MRFQGNPGLSERQLAAGGTAGRLGLPPDYLAFLHRANGGEGFVGQEYINMWRYEDLESFNREYQVAQYLRDTLLFASSGGGEAYGFRRAGARWDVVRVPFVGMSPDLCQTLAGSFAEFWTSLEGS